MAQPDVLNFADRQQTLSMLPLEIVRCIRGYTDQYDWNISKKWDASLIWEDAMIHEYYLKEQNQYHDEVSEWSLYGQSLLLKFGEERFPREPLKEPPPYSESNYSSPQDYYLQRIRWLNGH
jgi:hypothetical protein